MSKVPLALILIGTQPGRNAREGLAYIGVNAKSPQTYAGGALLANGARVAEIHAQYIVLEKNGQSARLYLKSRDNNKIDASGLNSLVTVGGVASPPPAVADSREPLTDFIRPSPVYENGVMTGYQVYAGARAGVFGQLGLRPGDVITALDGAPVTDPQSAIAQLEALTHGAAVTATVERKGQRQTVTLDGAVITATMTQADRSMAMPPPT